MFPVSERRLWLLSMHNQRCIYLWESGLGSLAFTCHHKHLNIHGGFVLYIIYCMVQRRCNVYIVAEIPRLLFPIWSLFALQYFYLHHLNINKCWVIVNWTLRNKLQWNFNQSVKTSHSRKCNWKHRLRNGGHFVHGEIIWYIYHVYIVLFIGTYGKDVYQKSQGKLCPNTVCLIIHQPREYLVVFYITFLWSIICH